MLGMGTRVAPDALGLVPRILLATDGTLTHILEAYTAEQVYLVKLSQSLVRDPGARATFDLDEEERALRRIILLRGTTSDTPYVYADSVVMLDRLPAAVADGLLQTDRPIGKLLFSCRAETFREILATGVEQDADVAARFGLGREEPLVARSYQIVFEGRPVARITEMFPTSSFFDTDL